MKFPKYLFITQDMGSDGTKWFQVHEEQVDAAEDDDKTGQAVATYMLVKTQKLEVVRTIKILGNRETK